MRRNAVTPARRSINRTGGDTSSQEGFINSSVLTGFLVIGVAAVLAMLFWLPYWLVSELLDCQVDAPALAEEVQR